MTKYVVPVVDCSVTTKERQNHHLCVTGIVCNVKEILTKPKQREVRGKIVSVVVEMEKTNKRNKKLKKSAGHHVDECGEEEGKCMSRFVKYQINVVQKVPLCIRSCAIQEIGRCR